MQYVFPVDQFNYCIVFHSLNYRLTFDISPPKTYANSPVRKGAETKHVHNSICIIS